jgi:hypothetical protein
MKVLVALPAELVRDLGAWGALRQPDRAAEETETVLVHGALPSVESCFGARYRSLQVLLEVLPELIRVEVLPLAHRRVRVKPG